MALKFVCNDAGFINYLALSTDIVDNKIPKASAVGRLVYLTNTGATKVILDDLTLGDYTLPVSFTGDVTLGEVSIDQTTPGTTNGVVAGVSAAGSDGIGNHLAVIKAPGSVNSAPLGVIPLVFNGTTFDRLRGNVAKGITVSNAVISTATAISGQITVTTAGTEVNGSDVAFTNGVYIKALAGNTGKVYVGNDGAGAVTASNGFELAQGEMLLIAVDNLNKLWFDSATSGDKFCWMKA